MNTSISAEEMQAIRQYHNARNRAWWAAQSKDERRERRQRYALNAIKRQQAERDDENKRYETKSKMRGKK